MQKKNIFLFRLIDRLIMNSIIINKDFRITIPKEVRKKYDFKPGQKFELFNTGYSIKLIPLK